MRRGRAGRGRCRRTGLPFFTCWGWEGVERWARGFSAIRVGRRARRLESEIVVFNMDLDRVILKLKGFVKCLEILGCCMALICQHFRAARFRCGTVMPVGWLCGAVEFMDDGCDVLI